MISNDDGRKTASDSDTTAEFWRELQSSTPDKPDEFNTTLSSSSPDHVCCPLCDAKLSAIELKMLHCLGCGKQVSASALKTAPRTDSAADGDFTVRI